MGFYQLGNRAPVTKAGGFSNDFLHRMGCKVCPLKDVRCKSPDMPADGPEDAEIYVLGTAPDAHADRAGRPFGGDLGQLIEMRAGKAARSFRWNYIVRTRPPEDRPPTDVEIECCRPSIVADIERVKPKAIFGFGNGPLKWLLRMSRPEAWAGRHIPVRVGNHACWFFPMLDPDFVLKTRRWEPRSKNEYGSDFEFKFERDLKDALALLPKLGEPEFHDIERATADIELLTGGPDDFEKLGEYIDEAGSAQACGFDYETNMLRPYSRSARILTAAISHKGRTFAFAYQHPGAKWQPKQLPIIRDMLLGFFKSPTRKLVHNLAFELEWTGVQFGREYVRAGKWEDSASQAYIIDERTGMTKPDCHSLEFLCLQRFGINLKDISNLDRKRLEQTPVRDVLKYNALDARYHRFLWQVQRREIEAEGMRDVYRHQLRRVQTAVLTQMKGVPVATATVKKFDTRFKGEIAELKEKIAASAGARRFKNKFGKAFSPSNNNDVAAYVKSILRLQRVKVDVEALDGIEDPLILDVLKLRLLAKQHSTYIIPMLPESPHNFQGVLHPILSTMKVRTWRTSSEDPNIQNYPKRKTREVRQQVAGGDDEAVYSFDFAGIQARNVAMESKDKALIKAFYNDYDIHTDWMQRIQARVPTWMRRKDREDKTRVKFFRNEAKNKLVFPLFFGARPKKVALELGIDERDATKLYDDFWGEFPSIRDWHEGLFAFYQKHGYVTGLSGFRRHAPCSPNILINTPIQGDESIIVLEAQCQLSETNDERLQANMEIHDDLSFVWKKREADQLIPKVLDAMLACPFPWINVPLQVELSVGPNWADQKEVGVYKRAPGGKIQEIK